MPHSVDSIAIHPSKHHALSTLEYAQASLLYGLQIPTAVNQVSIFSFCSQLNGDQLFNLCLIMSGRDGVPLCLA